MEEWHAIQVLKRQGHGKKAVARQLKISRNTVKRYWDSQAPPAYQLGGAGFAGMPRVAASKGSPARL